MGDIKADGCEYTAETLKELLADVPDANDADNNILIFGDLDSWDVAMLVVSLGDTG